MRNIILVNKPRGITPLSCIVKWKEKHPEYAQQTLSYAGRLDPMAQGLLLLLVGDENKKRKAYEGLPKSYEFTLLPGITTDTYDILGKVTSVSLPPLSMEKDLHSLLPSFIKTFSQPFPPYSSKPVNGKPLYFWARNNLMDSIVLPTKEVTITSLSLLHSTSLPSSSLVNQIITDVSKVTGNFRQEEIIQTWKEILPTLPSSLPLFTLQVTASSGLYVRALCNELGKKLGCGALAYSITRTAVGPYSLSDALSL